MKARIGETDSSANKGEIFYREVNATFERFILCFLKGLKNNL
jgi:hypothetical protein